MSRKLLDDFLKIDGVDQIKNVVPKATEALKKIRDIEESAGDSGIGGQAAKAMGQLMQQASAAMGGLQQVMAQLQSITGGAGAQSAAPTIPTGSLSASHEDAAAATDQAISDLTDFLNTLQMLEESLAVIDSQSAPISAFSDHTAFLHRIKAIDNALDTISTHDLSILPQAEIILLLQGITKVMGILAAVPEEFIVDYNLHRMVYAVPKSMSDLYFYGLDLSALRPSVNPLLTALRSANPKRLGQAYCDQFSRAADILEGKMDQEWTLTPTKQCVYDAVHRFYPEFHALLLRGNVTYDELTDLVKRLIDAISSCAATKQLGGPQGQSSGIPQIGSMIDASLSDFMQKSIVDQGKMSEAIKKFQKRTQIVQQKLEAAAGKFKKRD